MNETTVCPDCGNVVQIIVQGSSVKVKCSSCRYEIVTTKFPEIYLDEKRYTLTVNNDFDRKNKEKIKILAKIFGVNFLEAHQLATRNRLVIQKQASEIPAIKQMLHLHGFSFDISPYCKW